MLLREFAVLLGGLGVLLRLFVLADRVVVFSLKVMMRGRLVMTSRGQMMLGRRMFRHGSVLPCFELHQPECQSFDISLLIGG